MSPPLEHDYIGLSEIPSAVAVAGGGVDEGSLNLEATELRLGLPGSESPDRKDEVALTLELLSKSFASGSKRGFADAIDSDGKWGGEVGSEADLGKGGGLFSPRGEMAAAGGGHLAGQGNAGKDAVVSPVGQEKKAAAQAGGSVGHDRAMAPAAKQQVVGWPPIRSYRKNNMASSPSKNKHEADGKQGLGCLYVKVSMDGAPYLRKVDLKMYNNYKELSSALEKMFSCFTIGQCGSHGMPCKDGFSERHLMDLLNVSEYVVTYEDKDGDWMLVGDVPWEMFTDSCRRLRVMKGSDAIGLGWTIAYYTLIHWYWTNKTLTCISSSKGHGEVQEPELGANTKSDNEQGS